VQQDNRIRLNVVNRAVMIVLASRTRHVTFVLAMGVMVRVRMSAVMMLVHVVMMLVGVRMRLWPGQPVSRQSKCTDKNQKL
jgi:hypothetical protein